MNAQNRNAYKKIRKMTKMLRWWVSYDHYSFFFFLLTKFTSINSVHTSKYFFLQNLLVCALFTLVNFWFFFFFVFYKSYHASKFLNKKNLNKSNNDYIRPVIQAFLSFLSLFSIHRVCVHCLCIRCRFSTLIHKGHTLPGCVLFAHVSLYGLRLILPFT